MKLRRILHIIFFLLLYSGSNATHIVGGELGYFYLDKYLDENGVTQYVYQVTARLNKDVNASGTLPDAILLNVYNLVSNNFILQRSLYKAGQYPMPISTTLPCTATPPGSMYEVGIYSDTVALPYSVEGYSLSTSSCCRLNGLANIINSINTGATYTASIPPHSLAQFNSTPVSNDSIKIICKDVPAIFSVPFFDADDDELRYEFCGAYDIDGDPPYTSIKYAAGYNGADPLGGNPRVTIDPVTGIITGLVQKPGDYVVCFCVHEIRAGQEINVYRKEFQYRVTVCPTVNSLPENYFSCKNLTVTFTNNNNPAYSYEWDFGLSTRVDDTSSFHTPTFTYPDTGTYKVRVIIGRGNLCTDTSYSTVIAYPVVDAAFSFPALRCSANPLQFTDNSTATYGIGTRWKWYIQYPSAQPMKLADTLQNPLLRFLTQAGTDTVARVKLWVQTSKGCIDSVVHTIPINQSPLINAGPDLNFCTGDNAVINASCNSTRIQWQPPSFLSDPLSLKPNASPPVTTIYQLVAQNALCTASDSLVINVTPRPVPNAGPDTAICFGGSAILTGRGGQSFSWSPVNTLSNPLLRQPIARPQTSTLYILSVKDTLGCNRVFKDSVVVTVMPRLRVNAGKDTFVVLGSGVQLRASGASLYQWSPSGFLDDASKASPVATITSTQVFYVRGYTAQGCEGFDTMKVRLLEHEPDIFVPTAFSPNKDGKNDVLRPVGYGVEYIEIFAVYNRLGQQVFVSTTLGQGWDGTINGKRQPEGAYVWQLRARDFRNKVIEKRGTTILMR